MPYYPHSCFRNCLLLIVGYRDDVCSLVAGSFEAVAASRGQLWISWFIRVACGEGGEGAEEEQHGQGWSL